MSDDRDMLDPLDRVLAFKEQGRPMPGLGKTLEWRVPMDGIQFAAAFAQSEVERARLERIENEPCADALEKLWQDVILAHKPDYGPWEYPGFAYRHLLAEFNDLRAATKALDALNGQQALGLAALMKERDEARDARMRGEDLLEGWQEAVEEAQRRVREVESAMRDWTICFHCGARFRNPEGDDHGRTCPKHPQRGVERALAASQAENDALREALDETHKALFHRCGGVEPATEEERHILDMSTPLLGLFGNVAAPSSRAALDAMLREAYRAGQRDVGKRWDGSEGFAEPTDAEIDAALGLKETK